MTAGVLAADLREHPPGPRGWRALRYLRLPRLDLLVRLTRDFGDVACLRVGPLRLFMLGHPSVVHEVFVHQARDLVQGRTYRRIAFLLGRGLLTSDGEAHASQRRRLLPLLVPERVRSFADRMAALADASAAGWTASRSFDVHDALTRLASRLLTGTLLASGAREADPPAPSVVRLGTRVLDAWGETPGFSLLLRLPLPSVLALRALRRRLDAWARAVLHSPQPQGAAAPEGVARLLAQRDPRAADRPMSLDQARDELVTLLIAGHETTASALAFTLHLLGQHPVWEARLLEEVDAVLQGRLPGPQDLPKLDLCRRVLLEALRLYPPVFGLSRLANADLEVGGWRIPRGSTVYASPYALGRDARFWDGPERFDPDRWLPGRLQPSSREAFLSFGLGARRCIGESLFWVEAPIVLATLLRRWRFAATPGRSVTLQAAVTLRPARGIHMTPVPRAAAGIRS